ncbi:hypothetical protein PAERUG_P54_1_London_24_VIM_2_04_13_05103 [Pseudomonas aeruginosa]|nr:hypothetical protein PAERUG_P54_1_London_24_VIM_2_04_13_05103 [Pseudomonas aeruginosa]
MGVLLGLGDAQLGLAMLGQVLAEDVGQRLRREGAGRRDARRVLGQHDETCQLRGSFAGELIECRLDEGAAQLAGAVGAEVHEDHRVAILDPHRFGAGRDHRGGLDEFVALAAGVGGLEGCHRGVGGELGLAVDNQFIGGLDAVPAVVAVHREIAADDRGDAALAEPGEGGVETLQRRLRAFRRGIAAIQEGMQVDLAGAAPGGHLRHRHQVVFMAVYAARGEQAEDVHRLVGGDGLVDRAGDHRVFEEFAVADGLGDAGEVLVHHAACAEVHVADLGIAHLAVGQADVHAGAGDQAVRLGCQEAIPDRLLRGVDGVVVRAFAVAEAVQDDQDQGFGRGSHMSGSISAGFRN